MSIENDPCGILNESVRDDDGSHIHRCGRYVIGKTVYLSVLGTGPGNAGSGEVINIIQPCCPPCGIEPPSHGSIDVSETPAAQEAQILRALSKE
jgi:hypothetical protein